jgi:hypothetical protein
MPEMELDEGVSGTAGQKLSGLFVEVVAFTVAAETKITKTNRKRRPFIFIIPI